MPGWWGQRGQMRVRLRGKHTYAHRDRGGKDYVGVVGQRSGRVVWVLSPTRQAEKKLGLSGRQLRKHRKAARRG